MGMSKYEYGWSLTFSDTWKHNLHCITLPNTQSEIKLFKQRGNRLKQYSIVYMNLIVILYFTDLHCTGNVLHHVWFQINWTYAISWTCVFDQDFGNKQEDRSGDYYSEHRFHNQHLIITRSEVFLKYSKLVTEFRIA